MLSREIQDRGRGIILARFNERQEIFAEVREQIKHEAGAKGIVQSKVTYNALLDLCEREINTRIQIIGTMFFGLLATSSMSVTDEIAGSLKQIVRDYIPSIVEEMEGVLDDAAEWTGQQVNDSFDEVVEEALEKVDAEIDAGIR